jgi:50S ribosomal subunit-associated GTPase HflX
VNKPQIIVVNKIDAIDEVKLKKIKDKFSSDNINILTISALQDIGLDELINQIREKISSF